MKRLLKKCASHLSPEMQHRLKHRYFNWQIRHGAFRTPEPEFDLLPGMLSDGDWAVDVGANIGHYALRMSALVGPSGRVVAFEPVPETFELLTTNVHAAKAWNVTLINAAVSDSSMLRGMSTHRFEDTGLEDLYTAELVDEGGGVQVFCVSLDAMALSHRVALVKVDVEGHELAVLRGMTGLLKRCHPVLIVEDNDPEVPAFLSGLGYGCEKLPGSPNRMYRHGPGAAASRG